MYASVERRKRHRVTAAAWLAGLTVGCGYSVSCGVDAVFMDSVMWTLRLWTLRGRWCRSLPGRLLFVGSPLDLLVHVLPVVFYSTIRNIYGGTYAV